MEYPIKLGYVYHFDFKLLLNDYNGIYKLLSFLTIEEIRNNELDLFSLTFEPLGVSKEDFEAEFEIFYVQENSNIMKLQDVNDITKTIYIPEYYINKIPSFNVKPYQRLGLSINLGLFEDSNELELIKNEVNEILATKIGISNNAVVFSVEEKWLTNDEYEIIKQQREDNISDLSNIYSDNLELIKQITNLQSINNTYEEIIMEISC